jgi:hypothetical protein
MASRLGLARHDKILIATGVTRAVWSALSESARRSAINSVAAAMPALQRAKHDCNPAGSFSLHSPINGNLGQQVLVFENKSWFFDVSETPNVEVKS